MKILLLADQAEPTLWEHLDKRKLEGVELVLSCGDLPASYLSFLTCFTSAPILYIRGNHDDRYDKHPPEGCECIEDQVVTVGGLRILGLGGSMRYNRGINQYTERGNAPARQSSALQTLAQRRHRYSADPFPRAPSGRRHRSGAYRV